jgi:hypothetical protein
MEQVDKQKDKGPFWIQCENCFKWRRVTENPDKLPLNVSIRTNSGHSLEMKQRKEKENKKSLFLVLT